MPVLLRRAALAIALGGLLAGCASEDGAPPTESLALPESVRVVGHSYECPEFGCRRYLIVGPALEADRDVTTAKDVGAEVVRGLRADGWRATDAASPETVAARSAEHDAFVAVTAGTDQDPDAFGDRLDTTLRDMVADGQPVVAVTLQDDAP